MRHAYWLPVSAALTLVASLAWAQSAPNPFSQTRPTFVQRPFMFPSGTGFSTQPYQGITPGFGLSQQRPTFIQQPFMFPNGTAFSTQPYQGINPGFGLLQQRPTFIQQPYTFTTGTPFRAKGR